VTPLLCGPESLSTTFRFLCLCPLAEQMVFLFLLGNCPDEITSVFRAIPMHNLNVGTSIECSKKLFFVKRIFYLDVCFALAAIGFHWADILAQKQRMEMRVDGFIRADVLAAPIPKRTEDAAP
jgi:hypothetical protein